METLLDAIIGASATVLGITAAFLGYLRFSRFEDIKERISKTDYLFSRNFLFFSSVFGFCAFISAVFIRVISALNSIPFLIWLPSGLIIIQLSLTIGVICKISRPCMKHVGNNGVNKEIIARIQKMQP